MNPELTKRSRPQPPTNITVLSDSEARRLVRMSILLASRDDVATQRQGLDLLAQAFQTSAGRTLERRI